MAAPTFLGLVASDAVYSPWNSGSIVSPLTLTTLGAVPASTTAHPVALMLLLRIAPFIDAGGSTIPFGFDVSDITDDAPGPGGPNVWNFSNQDGDGGFAYDFGRPTFSCFPDFDIGRNGSADFPQKSGASFVLMVWGEPTRAMPSGTVITLPFTLGGTDEALFGATLLGFVDANIPVVNLSSRTLDPSDIGDGNSANVPLGDHIFSELLGGFEYIVAHAWTDDAEADGTNAILDTMTIDDLGTEWTKVDSGGYATTSDQAGLIYSVFVADASAIDLSEPLVNFLISDGIGFANGRAGLVMYRTQFAVGTVVAGNPTFRRVIPV